MTARHPSGEITRTMVAAIVRDKEIIGIQRTFLKLDAFGKVSLQPSKIIIGVVRGGAVRLARASETLVLSEGIETGLSVMQATGLAVWAALGAGNLAHVLIPDIVHEVIVAADHDQNGVGQRAAYRAAYRFIAQGRKVYIAIPSHPGNDFNDMLIRDGGAF
jgi:putative DNA primase/helicase